PFDSGPGSCGPDLPGDRGPVPSRQPSTAECAAMIPIRRMLALALVSIAASCASPTAPKPTSDDNRSEPGKPDQKGSSAWIVPSDAETVDRRFAWAETPDAGTIARSRRQED